MKNFIIKQMLKAQAKANELKEKAVDVIENNDGMSHTTEILLWTAGAAAIVLIVVTLFVTLTKTDIMPKLGTKISEIFNFTTK